MKAKIRHDARQRANAEYSIGKKKNSNPFLYQSPYMSSFGQPSKKSKTKNDIPPIFR